MTPPEEVRRRAREAVEAARWVRVEPDALPALEPAPPAEPAGAALAEDPEARATLLLCLAAIGFGSGWEDVRVRRGLDAAATTAAMLTERFVSHGRWTADDLRGLRAAVLADVLGQRRDHELVALQAQALRALGRRLAGRPVLEAVAADAAGSAERLAAALAGEVAAFGDPGFAARAQRAAADLAEAGLLPFAGTDRLTASADAALPAALRATGVLVVDPRLAALVDAGRALRPGEQERELRAGAVHACELLAAREGRSPRAVAADVLARAAQDGAPPPRAHLCRTTAY